MINSQNTRLVNSLRGIQTVIDIIFGIKRSVNVKSVYQPNETWGNRRSNWSSPVLRCMFAIKLNTNAPFVSAQSYAALSIH